MTAALPLELREGPRTALLHAAVTPIAVRDAIEAALPGIKIEHVEA